MGVQWSKPRKINSKDGGYLMLRTARLPSRGEPLNEELWSLWKARKETLKSEGFSVGKNNYYGGVWEMKYWHEVDDNSFDKNTDGEYFWEVDFKKKIARWTGVIENLQETLANPESIGTKTTRTPGSSKSAGRGNSSGSATPAGPSTGSDGGGPSIEALMEDIDDLDFDDNE